MPWRRKEIPLVTKGKEVLMSKGKEREFSGDKFYFLWTVGSLTVKRQRF